MSSKTKGTLEALLVDLGSQIQRGSAVSPETTEAPRFCSTGIPALDADLGGGFPAGRLCEICGAPSSGRTSLALALLAEALERGVFAAWIDLADAFDPASAMATGSDLERLLWVRARSEDEALRSSERLLQTEGFELIVLDLAIASDALARTSQRSPGIRDVSWLRMARLAASTRTTLVALSNDSTTGSRAELVLEMRARQAHFLEPPSLLETLETTAVPKRYRSRPIGRSTPLFIDAEPIDADRLDADPVDAGPTDPTGRR